MSYKFKIALSFATEEQELVEKVYHYLRAEKLSVFFAPSSEGQAFLSGKNQREVFYQIFGMDAEYVALFVSKHYVVRDVPMEEARIALAKHENKGSVIPIYLDGTQLPENLFNPREMNYYPSCDPVRIASHLAGKIKINADEIIKRERMEVGNSVMNIKGNMGEKQIFIQNMRGNIK